MRKIIFALLLAAVFTQTPVHAQVSRQDSLLTVHGTQIKGLTDKVSAIKTDIDTIKGKISSTQSTICKTCGCCVLDFGQWVLVFSPIILFFIALLIFGKKLQGFHLKESLTENDLPKRTIANPAYTPLSLQALIAMPNLQTVVPPTIDVSTDEFPKSSSRYIALITTSLTWMIGLSLTCFFIFEYLHTGSAPTLSGLSSVLISLGIGVVPYAFNKVSAAIKN